MKTGSKRGGGQLLPKNFFKKKDERKEVSGEGLAERLIKNKEKRAVKGTKKTF